MTKLVHGMLNAFRSCKERGSLALEQVLFIGAIALVGVGITAFYGKLEGYFQSVDVAANPGQTQLGVSPSGGATP